jgi:hypothetical protein
MRKEIIIAHFKHGTSYLTDTIRDNAVWIYMKANSEKLGIEDLGNDKLQFMQPRYDDYKKFITYRSVEDSFVSAFCYEMRSGLANFIVDPKQTDEEYIEVLNKFVVMAGGIDSMVSRWLTSTIQSNGTFMSIFYALVFPKVVSNILEYVDAIIPVKNLQDFFSARDVAIPNKIANQTDKRILGLTKQEFEKLGVFDRLKEHAAPQFEYKEKLLQKPLYDTI